MLSLVISTIVFFVAGYFLTRYFEGMGIPKGMTRNLTVFVLALLVAYGVAAAVDWLASHA
jgi:hypothetical protein